MKHHVTEHHAHSEMCACGHVHKAQHNTCAATPQNDAQSNAGGDTAPCCSHAADTGDEDAPAHTPPAGCACCGGQTTEEDGCGCEHGEADKTTIRRDSVRLGSSAALFIVGLCLPQPHWKTIAFAAAYLIAGYTVIWDAVTGLFSKKVFHETLLMTIATVGAAWMGDFAEACAVMLLFGLGELFENIAVGNTKRSISSLLELKPDYAHKRNGNDLVTVAPGDVAVGDHILVKPFERIPLDGEVIDGDGFVDERALTGESVPVRKCAGSAILAGGMNGDTALTVLVTAAYADSAVSKIIRMTEQAAKQRAPREKFITRFARVYTPAVVGLAVLIAVVPPLLGGGVFREWLYTALTLLVISCPCALVISVPLAYFAGLGGSSRTGVLAKGAAGLDALANVKTIAFDKTGTLTKGAFTVTDVQPTAGITAEELVALCAHAESASTHPIGKAIVAHYGASIDTARIRDITETRGHGVRAVYDGKPVLAGNAKHLRQNGVIVPEQAPAGTVVYAARDGVFSGFIVLGDTLKEDAAQAVSALKARGIQTVMLTGDNEQTARHVAQALGIDTFYAGLLPEDKVSRIRQLQAQTGGGVAFVGDGINDAPVIAAADVGISMGGLGSDAAIEASDIVLMTDEPSKLSGAIAGAQTTRRIVTQNIVLALGIKGVIILLSLFGISSMWLAIVADVGACLLAVANSMRALGRTK